MELFVKTEWKLRKLFVVAFHQIGQKYTFFVTNWHCFMDLECKLGLIYVVVFQQQKLTNLHFFSGSRLKIRLNLRGGIS